MLSIFTNIGYSFRGGRKVAAPVLLGNIEY